MALSGAEQTRTNIARSAKEMMRTTPVSKIRVRRLCRAGNIRPRQFRSVFRSKHELMEWVFYSEIVPQILRCQGDSDAFMQQICTYFHENRAVYRTALASERRNAFLRSYNEVAPILAKELVALRYTENELIRDRLESACTILSDTFREALFDWLNDAEAAPPAVFAHACLAKLDAYAELVQCFKPSVQPAF